MLTTTRKLRAAEARAEAAEAQIASIKALLPVREPDVQMTLAERVEFMLRCYDMAKETIDDMDRQADRAGEHAAKLVRELGQALNRAESAERELATLKASRARSNENLKRGTPASAQARKGKRSRPAAAPVREMRA